MSNVIQLPFSWDEVQTGWQLVDEGEYATRVEGVTEQQENRVVATLKILDAGPFEGRLLYDSFFLEAEAGLRLLKEFTDAIGVDTSSRQLDTTQCVGKVLRVTVRHRDGKDNKVYANVTRHTPAHQSTD